MTIDPMPDPKKYPITIIPEATSAIELNSFSTKLIVSAKKGPLPRPPIKKKSKQFISVLTKKSPQNPMNNNKGKKR